MASLSEKEKIVASKKDLKDRVGAALHRIGCLVEKLQAAEEIGSPLWHSLEDIDDAVFDAQGALEALEEIGGSD